MKKPAKQSVISIMAKFRVTQKKSLNFDLSTEELRQFPTHEQYLHKYTTEEVIHTFKPTSNLDIDNYISRIASMLKKQFNAESVRLISKIKV